MVKTMSVEEAACIGEVSAPALRWRILHNKAIPLRSRYSIRMKLSAVLDYTGTAKPLRVYTRRTPEVDGLDAKRMGRPFR
jgi:hypothetical protein